MKKYISWASEASTNKSQVKIWYIYIHLRTTTGLGDIIV